MIWTILLILLILIVITALISFGRNRKKSKSVTSGDVFAADMKPVGMYVGGYPDKDESKDNCFVIRKDDQFDFFRKLVMENPVYLFSIRISYIKAISVDDIFTIEEKMERGSFLFADDFATTWEERNKEDISFLSIDWLENDNAYSTTFFFQGNNAVQQAKKAKSDLMKMKDL